MAVSATDKELLGYFSKLSEPQKKSLLELIKTFLQGYAETGGNPSIEEYNRELDEAMSRLNAGSFTSLNDLEKEMQKW